jgi:hypothetical protein
MGNYSASRRCQKELRGFESMSDDLGKDLKK